MDTWFGYQHYWNKFLNIKWGTQSLAVSVNPGYLCVLRGLGCVCVSTRVCEDACTDASPEQRGLRKMSGVLLHQSSSLSFIPFIPLRQGLSLNLDLGWWPASPNSSSLPQPLALVLQTPATIAGILYGFWRVDLRSSGLHCKPSCLLSHSPNPSTLYFFPLKTQGISTFLNYQHLLCL